MHITEFFIININTKKNYDVQKIIIYKNNYE